MLVVCIVDRICWRVMICIDIIWDIFNPFFIIVWQLKIQNSLMNFQSHTRYQKLLPYNPNHFLFPKRRFCNSISTPFILSLVIHLPRVYTAACLPPYLSNMPSFILSTYFSFLSLILNKNVIVVSSDYCFLFLINPVSTGL